MTPADHARNFAYRVAINLTPHTASGWNPSMPERVGSAILLGFVFVALPGWMLVLPALGLVTVVGAIVDMAERSLEERSCTVLAQHPTRLGLTISTGAVVSARRPLAR